MAEAQDVGKSTVNRLPDLCLAWSRS